MEARRKDEELSLREKENQEIRDYEPSGANVSDIQLALNQVS